MQCVVKLQAVVQMNGGQKEIPSRRQFPQHVEQTHRIGPARYRHADPLAAAKHRIAVDCRRNTVEEIGHPSILSGLKWARAGPIVILRH